MLRILYVFVPEIWVFLGLDVSATENGTDSARVEMKDVEGQEGTVSVVETERTKHTANPFWDSLTMTTKRKRLKLHGDDGPKAIVSLATGHREGFVQVTRAYEVDAERFVKIFTRHLTVFFDLSQNGLRLFEYVLFVVGNAHSKDAIHMHPKDADRYHKNVGRKGYSRSSYYRAVSELCDRGLIAEADIPWKYFINPAVYWNGDRAAFVTELRKAPQIYEPGEVDPVGGDGINWPEADPDSYFTDD